MGMIFGKIDVECAKHTILYPPSFAQHNDYSLRKYAPHVLASVPSDAAQENEMFRILARYIGVFGTPENTALSTPKTIAMTAPVLSTPETIAMTAPVLSTPETIAMTAPVLNTGGGQQSMSMSFVLPNKYQKAQEAPQPTDSRVKLIEVPERFVAVKTFSGTVSMEEATIMADEFKHDLENKGFNCIDWQLARYNPP